MTSSPIQFPPGPTFIRVRRYRLEWISLGLFLLALGALVGRGLYQQRIDIDTLERDRLQVQARVIEDNLGRQLEGVNNALLGIRQNLPHWTRASIGVEGSRQLKILSAAMPGVRAMGIFDAEGTALASSRENLVGNSIARQRDFFKIPRARPDPDVLYVSPPFESILGVFSINVVRAVTGPGGEFAGIVAATLEPEYFEVALRSVLYAPDMRTTLAYENGKAFLFVPANAAGTGMSVDAPGSFFRRHLESGLQVSTLVGTSVVTGEDRLMVSRTIRRSNLGMDRSLIAHVSRDLSAIYAPWREDAYRYGALYALFAAAATISLFFAQRRRRAFDTIVEHEQAERQLAETAVRQSEQRFRDLLQNIPSVAVQGYATDGTTQYWNLASERLYGYSAQEAVGRNLLDLIIPARIRAAARAEILRMAETGEPMAASELSLMRKDGSRVTVYSSHAVVNVPGRAPELFSIDIDLTALKSALAELRQSNAFRELLLEAIPLPVYYKDASGRYTGCNSAFVKFIGAASHESVIGRRTSDFAPGEFAQNVEKQDSALLEGAEDTQVYEGRVPGGDGTLHDVIIHRARMSDDAGRPAGIIAAITDITYIRRTEAARDELKEQLRESQKMEALGTLAGGVAHDFNNIIMAIMGNARLARDDIGPGDNARTSLEEIYKASLRAKDLVQQILAFSRRQKLERRVISLAPVVQEAARLLRATLPAGVNLEVNCDPDAPAVLADAAQVQQVLLNLGSNAWHAMHGRPGVIEIGLESRDQAPAASQTLSRGAALVASGDVSRPRRGACLTVRDNGSGMDESTRARIFEPFFTTKPVGSGTGLGLAVVHGIVQDHEATVDVQSTPGKGTTFTICFPHVDAGASASSDGGSPTEPPDLAGESTDGQGRHILYLDDDESIVLLIGRLLERRGYRVSGYTDSDAAISAVRANPTGFNLAVTDFNMPHKSGLEVARALREISPDMPLALASGYITDELREEAPAAGVSELIYKPSLIDDLCDAVARLASAPSGRRH